LLDLRLIREQTDAVRAALARRGEEVAAGVDDVIALDARRRELLPALESIRAAKNTASQGIAQAKRSGEDTAAAIESMRAVGEREKQLETELAGVDAELQSALLSAMPCQSSSTAILVMMFVPVSGRPG